MSKSFLYFFPPDSFSLQTGVQAAATSMSYHLPHSNQSFPSERREDDSDSQMLNENPSTCEILQTHFWKSITLSSHAGGRIANFIWFKTFCISGRLKQVPWILCCLIPVLCGKEWNLAQFWSWIGGGIWNRLTLSLRLPWVWLWASSVIQELHYTTAEPIKIWRCLRFVQCSWRNLCPTTSSNTLCFKTVGILWFSCLWYNLNPLKFRWISGQSFKK